MVAPLIPDNRFLEADVTNQVVCMEVYAFLKKKGIASQSLKITEGEALDAYGAEDGPERNLKEWAVGDRAGTFNDFRTTVYPDVQNWNNAAYTALMNLLGSFVELSFESNKQKSSLKSIYAICYISLA